MISTLQKRLQYAALSLMGSSSSSRIVSHIGHDNVDAGVAASVLVVGCWFRVARVTEPSARPMRGLRVDVYVAAALL